MLSGKKLKPSWKLDLDNIGTDFTFTRTGEATYTNVNGQILTAVDYGSDLVTNGLFSTDSDWTKGGNWSIGSGVATNTPAGFGALTQNIGAVNGKSYLIEFDLTHIAGALFLDIGSQAYSTSRNASGSYSVEITASGTSGLVYFTANASFEGSIDNVSIKEIIYDNVPRKDYSGGNSLGDNLISNGNFDSDTTGWSVYNSTATLAVENQTLKVTDIDGGYGTAYQSFATEIGKNYVVSFEMSGVGTSGSRQVKIGSSLNGGQYYYVALNSTVKVYSYEFTATTTTSYIHFLSGTGAGLYSFWDKVEARKINQETETIPHLLLEAAGSNLALYSGDLTNAAWTKINGGSSTTPVVTSNHANGPDGTLSADRIQATLSGSTDADYSIVRQKNVAWTNEGTWSMWLKSNTGSNQDITIKYTKNADGVITVTNEWRLFQITDTQANGFECDLGLRGDHTDASMDILVWEPQFEEQDHATSRMPSGAAAGSRGAELCVSSGYLSQINSASGMIFLEMAALSISGTFRMFSLSNGTSSNRINVYYNSSNSQLQAVVRANGATVCSLLYYLPDATKFSKIAFSWQDDDYKLYHGGEVVASDNAGTSFTSDVLDDINFADTDASGYPMIGKIRQAEIYKEINENKAIAFTTIS